MPIQPSQKAQSQTSQQIPSNFQLSHQNPGNNQQISPNPNANPDQLVAEMGSLSVAGLQGHSPQHLQQQSPISPNTYVSQNHGQPYATIHGQRNAQLPATTPQPIRHSNSTPAIVHQPNGYYPTGQGNSHQQQQYAGFVMQSDPNFSQGQAGNPTPTQYTSYNRQQYQYPGTEAPFATLYQNQYSNPVANALTQLSRAPSTSFGSVPNTPASRVSSIPCPYMSPLQGANQQTQTAHYNYQSQHSQVVPIASPTTLPIQSYQLPNITSHPAGSGHTHHSKMTESSFVQTTSPAGQHSSQSQISLQQTPVSAQDKRSQAPAPGPQVLQSGVQHQNIQRHQNITQPQFQQGAQYQPQYQTQTQYQSQQYPVIQSQPHHQSNPQEKHQTQHQYQPHQQPQYHQQTQQQCQAQAPSHDQPRLQQPHPPQNTQFIANNAAQQPYNSQLAQPGQRQNSGLPQRQQYQPQIANAQFMPNSYKPPQVPSHLTTGIAQSKPAPKFANDPMAATTSFLGKSYKSTTKFLGTKKGMKYAAGGAGVLLAGILGVEVIDGLGDSGDVSLDSGSGGIDTSGGYDASGGYDSGSYGVGDAQNLADATALADAQMLAQQEQMMALNDASNQMMVQGGISFSEAAGNSYSYI